MATQDTVGVGPCGRVHDKHMTGDTHRIEKATGQAANGYRISALEAEIKELKKRLRLPGQPLRSHSVVGRKHRIRLVTGRQR